METVAVMDRIIRAAEAERDTRSVPTPDGGPPATIAEALCHAAASAAAETQAAVLAVMTESGMTARLLSKHQPTVPIVAFTPHESVCRRMALYWGVVPRPMAWMADADAQLRELERRVTAEHFAVTGDRVVVLAGTVAGRPGGTNIMKLHVVQQDACV